MPDPPLPGLGEHVGGRYYQLTKGSFGEAGSAVDVSRTNPQPVDDWKLEIPRGNRPGLSPMIKFGENPNINNSGDFFHLWDATGLYAPPTIPRIHNVASDNAADAGNTIVSGTATGGSVLTLVDTSENFVTAGVVAGDIVLSDTNCDIGIVSSVATDTLTVNGFRDPETGFFGDAISAGDSYRVVHEGSTGACVVYLQGLDSSFLLVNEFVVLNGISDVATVNSYIRQYRARSFGTTRVATLVGVLTSTAVGDGTVSCQINDGKNQTQMAIYTIPFDKNAYILQWWGSLSKAVNAISIINLRVGQLDGFGYIVQPWSLSASGQSSFCYEWGTRLPLPGGADIWIEANSNLPSTGVSGGFDIILVDKVS